MANKKPGKNTEKKKIKRSTPGAGLTLAVLVFAVLLIGSIVLIFMVSGKIDSMQGADSQIKLAAQGGFNCEYS